MPPHERSASAMADDYVTTDSAMAAGRKSPGLDLVAYSPVRNRTGSPRVSPRALRTHGEDDMYAGCASVGKLKIDEKEMHPDTLPTEFGTGLTKYKSAGGAGMNPIFTKRETSPTGSDYDNDKGKSTPRSLLDKIKNAGGASEKLNKLKTTSGTLELMDDDRSMVGTEGVSGKTRTTGSFEILDNLPTLGSTGGVLENIQTITKLTL